MIIANVAKLMTDATGQGWVQHLVGGTSKALLAAGPTVCLTGRGKRFFTEIRMFEVCRAIIFNEPTFLANSEWRILTASIHPNEQGKDCGLNALMDIITSCSTLRVRYVVPTVEEHVCLLFLELAHFFIPLSRKQVDSSRRRSMTLMALL